MDISAILNVYMNKISKASLIDRVNVLRAETGLLAFYEQNRLLYVCYTFNLEQKLSRIMKSRDKYVFKLLSLTDTIGYDYQVSIYNAFLEYKKLLYKHNPEYNSLLSDYSDYFYLAFDLTKPPFFSISEQTLETNLYLGPFRNRFFPQDFLDTMHELFRLPLCGSEEYPCDLKTKGKCDGICLEDNRKVFRSILDNYLLVNQENMAKISLGIKEAEDDLRFNDAENLKRGNRIIRKYYDYLRFFHVTKHLDIDIGQVRISKGLIYEIDQKNVGIKFEHPEIFYRKNEYLAHQKNELNERWIVYEHLKKDHGTELKKIYLKSKEELLKLLQA
jgi:excinuclease UvrABC nuclease subunit